MAIKMTNNAASTLASNVSSGATSFTVVSGSSFPTFSSGDHSYVTIGTEVIKVTARNSAVFTCIATGASHSAGDTVELRVTAELLNDFSTDAESLAKAGGEMSGNITMAGSQTVDGRDLSADGSKLDGIDTGAKNDQTASEIKTLLENGIDSVHYVNASIDTEHIGDDQVTADKLANSINSAIAANTSKTGITSSQANAITANTAKTGISSAQTSAITANTAKTGITSSQATAITAALPKAGGTMTGNLVMGTNLVDGIDISARDAVLTSTTTTAGAALPKAGGTMTGALAINTADNALVITSTGGGSTVDIISTSSTATDAPELKLYKNSSSPAANDQIGYFGFHSNDNAGNDTAYASMYTNIDDVTNGSEDGSMHFKVKVAGANAERLALTATGATITGDLTSDNFQVKSTAPSSPSQGDVWFNSSASTVSNIPTKKMAVYNGSGWKEITNSGMAASGGTKTTSGGYTIHTFTSSGTFTPNKGGTVDYLVVGGGGGSGGFGGGGGAGGFKSATDFTVTATGLTVTVGAGGAGSDYNGLVASNGGNSVFSSITSLGGGGGSSRNHTGANGGSGGGGNGGYGTAGGSGTSGQGNNGGTAAGNQAYHGAGGGGASQTGGNGTTSCGNGGAGTASSYSGSSVTYAGGGGGATDTSDNGGAGGAGGGGKGKGGDGAATAGSANTGGGGGAGSNVTTGSTAGGSGIVIIRYLT